MIVSGEDLTGEQYVGPGNLTTVADLSDQRARHGATITVIIVWRPLTSVSCARRDQRNPTPGIGRSGMDVSLGVFRK